MTNLNLLMFTLVLCSAESLKILGIFPFQGKSHFMVFEPLLKEMAKRNHEITVVSEFPQEVPLPNYKDMALEKSPELAFLNLNSLPPQWILKYATMVYLTLNGRGVCERLAEKPFQDLINTKEQYDLLLIEYFNTDCFLAFAHKFKIPLIGIISSYQLPWHLDRFGNPDNPAYITNHFVPFPAKMTFLERVENTIMYILARVVYYFLMELPGHSTAKKYFGEDLPPLNDIAQNTSLFLKNTFFGLQNPQPNVPGIIEVGGMNIGEPKTLPQNLEKWINESTDGVIFFSMGSMIKGHTFPEEKREMFVRAFSRLKQRVLWKWENETLPNKPANVMIQKWMPQFDILCHPNVKAFITHGGLLSTTEAVHCGVPAVVMPQFGDQYTNARALESSGGGIILHFSTITEEDVYNALKTVLDPSFNKQAKELSVRFKDRPMPPLETAIYWIEYVARHKGAPHLRSAAVGMPYYQYLLLDVIAFLLFVILIIGYVCYIVTRLIFRKLFKRLVKVKKQ